MYNEVNNYTKDVILIFQDWIDKWIEYNEINPDYSENIPAELLRSSNTFLKTINSVINDFYQKIADIIEEYNNYLSEYPNYITTQFGSYIIFHLLDDSQYKIICEKYPNNQQQKDAIKSITDIYSKYLEEEANNNKNTPIPPPNKPETVFNRQLVNNKKINNQETIDKKYKICDWIRDCNDCNYINNDSGLFFKIPEYIIKYDVYYYYYRFLIIKIYI